MARFALSRDIRFFEGISRELVDAVVTTAVVLYKLIIEDSKPNLYGKLYFDYFVKDDFTNNSTTVTANVISDYSDIPYDFIQYSNINDVGKQWIRKYTLALVKELLGAIREKYSTIPIPGSEISLDGAALRSEAQTEKEALMTQLRETLEELSRKVQFENKANEAKQQQEMLQKVPLAIYIG